MLCPPLQSWFSPGPVVTYFPSPDAVADKESDALGCVFTVREWRISQIKSVILGRDNYMPGSSSPLPSCDSFPHSLPHIVLLPCDSSKVCMNPLNSQMCWGTLLSAGWPSARVPSLPEYTSVRFQHLLSPESRIGSKWGQILLPKSISFPQNGLGWSWVQERRRRWGEWRKTSYPWLYYPSAWLKFAKQITDLWQFKRGQIVLL